MAFSCAGVAPSANATTFSVPLTACSVGDRLTVFVARSTTPTVASSTPTLTNVRTDVQGGLAVDVLSSAPLTSGDISAGLTVNMTGSASKTSVGFIAEAGVTTGTLYPTGSVSEAGAVIGASTDRLTPTLAFTGTADVITVVASRESPTPTATGYVAPSGYTKDAQVIFASSGANQLGIGHKDSVASSPTGVLTWTETGSTASGNYIGYTMAPALAGAPPPTLSAKWVNDAGVEVTPFSMKFVDDTGVEQPLFSYGMP